jgi:hypothetical protein
LLNRHTISFFIEMTKYCAIVPEIITKNFHRFQKFHSQHENLKYEFVDILIVTMDELKGDQTSFLFLSFQII